MADESGILRAEAAAASSREEDAASRLRRRMEALVIDDREEEDAMDPLSMLRKLEAKMRKEEAEEKDDKTRRGMAQNRVDVKRLQHVEVLYVSIVRDVFVVWN